MIYSPYNMIIKFHYLVNRLYPKYDSLFNTTDPSFWDDKKVEFESESVEVPDITLALSVA